MNKKFNPWIVHVYKEWSANKLGQEASEAAFGRWLGRISQRVISSWLHDGKVPTKWSHVNALIRHYGDEAREVLGIDTPVIVVDQLPPRLVLLLHRAVDEINFELVSRGLDSTSEEA